MTLPLLEGLDGVNKMSKSLGNYIGITEPANDIYGKVLSASDELMFRYFDLLSDLGREEIAALKADMEAGTLHPKKIKQQLARELTTRFHSAEAALQAEANFENVFRQGGLPDDIPEKRILAKEEIWLPQLLVDLDLVKSTSDGRRMIKQNAVSLDGEKVCDLKKSISPQGNILIKVGKRRFCKVLFE